MNSFVKFPLSIGCIFLLKRYFLIIKYKVRPGILSHFLIRSKREGYLFAEQSFFINIARAKLKGVSKRFFNYHLYIIRTTDNAIKTSKAV